MKKELEIFGTVVLLLNSLPPLVSAQTNPSTWYPKIDASLWTLGSFQDGTITGAQKGIIPLAGQPSAQTLFFASIRLTAASINNVNYVRNQVIAVSHVSNNYSQSLERRVDYTIGPWTVRTLFTFLNDGRLLVQNSFIGTQPTSSRLWIRFDPDINGLWNDIVEYVEPKGGTENWRAPAVEYQRAYNPMADVIPSAYERTAYCRVVDAGSTNAGTQLFMAFMQMNAQYHPQINFVSKVWTSADEAGTAMPAPNTAVTLQQTNAAIGTYDRAAWVGSDQVLYAGINRSSGGTYDLEVKVYRKPNGRSLQINIFTNSANPPLSNWATLPVAPGGSGRSANDAFNDITLGRWQLNNYPGMVNNVTGDMTVDQMHALMYSERSRVGSPLVSRSFQDWYVDALILNCRWSGVAADGLMFDWPGGSGIAANNAIAREAVAIFYEGTGIWGSPADNFLGLVIPHEVGHALNMHHEWADNPGSPTDVNIMAPSPVWPPDYAMTWGQFQLSWVRAAPEGWVKPGRYGARGFTPRASSGFRTYYTGTVVAP